MINQIWENDLNNWSWMPLVGFSRCAVDSKFRLGYLLTIYLTTSFHFQFSKRLPGSITTGPY